ncbi:unnamed protein product [Ceutorhynchus assimilis]|uniref:Transmembrane protein n=1 Tax=Ceutorhynchus assimilis TaxID=467358 RepID=A0A9N9QKL1_9CUCU|nr:unnamed protein product [Ceutorhynchus assimilis]
MEFKATEAEGKLLSDGIQKIVVVRQENKNKPCAPVVLSVVDIFLSVFVVTPLVVFVWRGSWLYMDVQAQYFPLMPCFFIGMAVHVILALSQDVLHAAIVESDKHWSLKIVSHFLRRFYTYVFLNITVFHWRGGWGLIDSYLHIQFTKDSVAEKEGIHWFLMIWVACFITLIVIKGLRNAIAPPFAICIDKGNYVFKFPTMFKRTNKQSSLLAILDCFFSVGVMGNLVVTLWRGLWVLIDLILLPDNFIWSSWSSLVLGLLVIGLVFRLQNFMKNLCTKTSGLTKIVIADFYIILSCIAIILYWRGVWNVTNIYFLPDDPELSGILSHFIGYMFLVVLGCSNSLLVRGVYIDGKEPNGECVVLPCQYLRIIFEQEDSCEEEESDLGTIKMMNSVEV